MYNSLSKKIISMFQNIIVKYLSKYFYIVGCISAVSVTIVLLIIQIDQAIKIPSYGIWGIFHYYLGAKYIQEIGYFDLYSCAIQVNATKWHETKLVRNLHTYRLVPLNQLPKCPRNNFVSTRWKEFVADTTFITSHATANYWSTVITDKGFNPPPSWAAIAGTIAHIVPLDNKFTYLILFNLDLLFIFFAALLVWYDSGSNAGLITLTLSLLYFGTFDTLGNNFLQYAWYPFIVASVVAWRKKKPIISGIAIGIAAGLQVFPIFFAIPVGCLFFISLLRRQKDQVKISSVFILSSVGTLLICIMSGSIYAGKIEIWQQWYNKITVHKNYINGEIFNIGFTNLIGVVMSKDHANSYSYTQDYSHTLLRNETIEQNADIINVIVFFGLLLIFFALWRSKQNQPIVYGYFLLYLLLSLSPYYYLMLALLPFMFWNNSLGIRQFVLYGICCLFFLHIIFFWNSGYISFNYIPQLISKILIFLFFSVLMVLLVLEKRNRLAVER